MKTSSQDVLITKNGLYTNDNQQENDINTVTAETADSNIKNLNDPNLMSVIEKQNTIAQFSGLTSQYNVLVQNAKDDGIDTTAVTTAYNNLNRFMADILADPDHASDIDRVAYKKYQDAYNQELANIQNALQNNANSKFASAASAASSAAIATSQAFSAADSAYNYANSEIAVQSTATAKAQSSADNAFNQAQTIGSQASSAIAIQSTATAKAQSAANNALSSASAAVATANSTASEFGKVSQKADGAFDNALSAQSDASAAVAQASSAAADSKDAKQIAGAVSQSYKTLTDGSTMTIAELENGLATKLTKTDLDGYATETWTQNQIKVTADGINATLSSVKSTVDGHTTSINNLKADSSSFKSQFTTVNNTIGKQSTDISSLQASSKELTTGFNTLTTDNGTNKNDISQLKQTATELNSTMMTVQTQVGNSAVGTNLYTDTKNFDNLASWSAFRWWTKTTDAYKGLSVVQTTANWTGLSQYVQVKKGDILTYSIYAKNTSGTGTSQISWQLDSQAEGSYSTATTNPTKNVVTITDSWQKVSGTAVATNDGYLRPRIERTPNNTNTLQIAGIKVEKGSVATDWCPNPADTATKSQFTQLSGEIAQKVDSADFSSYKTQTASLISSKVDNGDFSTYKTQTAQLIGSKVDNGTYQSDKTQTANMIASKVSTVDFNNLTISNRNLVLGTATPFTMTGNNSTNNVGYMYHLSKTISKGTTVTVAFDITSTSSTGNYTVQFLNGSWQKFTGTNALPLFSGTQHHSYTLTTDDDYTNGVQIRLDNSTSTVTVSNFIISESSKEVSWSPAPEDQATKSQITQLSGEIAQKVDSGDFSSYKTQTASLISSKVDNGDFSAYQATTAKGISSKVESSDFKTLQTQVNNSAVGPNLLTGTSYHTVMGANASGYLSNETNDDFLSLLQRLEGETVTVSVDYEYSGFVAGSSQNRLGWETKINADKTSYFNLWYYPSNDSGSGRMSATYVVPRNITSVTHAAGYIQFSGSSTGTLSHLKLEKGSVATDWSLNPEEQATQSQITQLSGEIAQKVESGDFSSYKTQTAKLIGSKVANSDFSTYKTQTADLISSKVATKDFSAYQATTAKSIESKVESSDFNTYKTQTADLIASKVSSNDFKSYQTQTADLIDAKVSNSEYVSDKKQTADLIASKVANGDFSSYKIETARLIGSKVNNDDFSSYKTQTAELIESRVDNGTYQSDKTQTADLISQAVKKNDVVNQINISNEGILIDGKKVHITGNTSIDNAVIKNSMIANTAINTAQIADGAINNAKIANATIDDAKISNLNGNKIIAGSITANKINVNDLIANGINTKTLTAVNLNASTMTTPQLDLGFNGTFTEDFDYTQNTSIFLPKKNKGTLTFNHGVLQSRGNMQTFVNGKWGGMNDNYTFQAGLDNSQWTEVAPGYIKFDLFKQNDIDVAERTYIDPTGYYYTSRNGIASYLGNILQTSQVQTPSVFAKYIGPSDGELRLQIGQNGKDYGLQVGSYAGKEAVLSDFIYGYTTSGEPNIHIDMYGRLARSTSASKYKYNIKNPDIEDTLGDRLLNVHLATWNDKRAVDLYAEQLSTGEEREKTSIDKYYGLIAEQLRDAGLDMFINYGKNHEIEGIKYDRAWVPLLSVIRRLNNKVNEYELRLSKLEGANK